MSLKIETNSNESTFNVNCPRIVPVSYIAKGKKV